ncbi:MAG: DNA polymerase III subunit [Candidatus Moraniibacteriota bacterium]
MSIIGHKKIINSLNQVRENKHLSHAYLFCGPEAVGKFLVARNFASELTGESGNLNRNLFIIEPQIEEKDGIFKEKEIKTEEIKKLQKEFSLTSFGANYRVVIIRSAQKMNVSAQNALLKILEEPPENSVLILVAENEKKLLPTILSRCQIVRFNLLLDKEIELMFSDKIENKKEIIFWSLGRPGLARKFLENKAEIEERIELVKEFNSLFSMELNERLFLAEKISKNTPLLLQKMDFWVMLLRKYILGEEILAKISPSKALKLIENIQESKKIISTTNSNARLVVENLLVLF